MTHDELRRRLSKYKPEVQTVQKTDAVKNYRPVVVKPVKYKPKADEVIFRSPGQKPVILKRRNEVISADNRNSTQRQSNLKEAEVKKWSHQQQKNNQEFKKLMHAMGTLYSPSTYIGPVFNANGKSYMDNVLSGEGIGDAAGNVAIDLLTPTVVGKGVQGIINASKQLSKSYKPFIVSQYMNRSYKPNGLSTVNNLFRNSEWSNFLATKNGNYYYKLQEKPGLVSTNVRKDNGGYFISHTTPWEEFSGLGTPYPIGPKVAYEFPHKTFGGLKASNSNGIYGPHDVSELGKLHLLYGNTSSGRRDFVRLLSDDDAKYLDMNPFTIGIKDRPKGYNGLYDTDPIYERLSQGNQTVISPQKLNNALQNTSYNKYEYSPQGIVKSIYSPIVEDIDRLMLRHALSNYTL